MPGIVSVVGGHAGRYPILGSDLRSVSLTRIRQPTVFGQETRALCRQATDALACRDHVRVDIRVDAAGELKIIDGNGIHCLKSFKSWSHQIYILYHGSSEGPLPSTPS